MPHSENEYHLLTKAGHEVVAHARSNHDVSHYVSVRQLALAKRTIWASDTREEFRQLLLREKPEIVHVHNTFLMVSPSIYWACRDAKLPPVFVVVVALAAPLGVTVAPLPPAFGLIVPEML